ncbi:MAG: hypothetical protein ACP5D0_01715 [Hydrogenovibrio sp.]
MMKPALSIQQKQLAKHCYWDVDAQVLWVDGRQWKPKMGVLSLPGWDNMMVGSEPIPAYPDDLAVLSWPDYGQLGAWRKQIPSWVKDSCALFPTHQLTLLHYVGRYPQLLELLDHSPMLAWRLVASGLPEAEIVALLSDKRTQMVAEIGWPGKPETVQFLRKLRLRYVTEEISDFVEVCVMDEDRLEGLQTLPRVNSMALSLAARFPQLIGSRLHQSLARLPCRPMQCQSLVAQLEDVYRAAKTLQLADSELEAIGACRYLVEVATIYQAWWFSECTSTTLPVDEMSRHPLRLTQKAEWEALSHLQKHYWLTDWSDYEAGKAALWAWRLQGEWVGILLHLSEAESKGEAPKLARVRQLENQLPTSEQLSAIHLWLAGRFEAPQT